MKIKYVETSLLMVLIIGAPAVYYLNNNSNLTNQNTTTYEQQIPHNFTKYYFSFEELAEFSAFTIDKNNNLILAYGSIIRKVNPFGEDIWSIEIDGSIYVQSLKVDSENDIILIANSYDNSLDYTIGNSYSGDVDGFIVKISSQGEIMWSRYFGGNDEDIIRELQISHSGNIYITGSTWSNDFPIKNSIHSFHTGGNYTTSEAFITKLHSNGEINWSTYLGGSDYDYGVDIEIDQQNSIHILIESRSDDLFGTNITQKEELEFITYIANFNVTGQFNYGNYIQDGNGSNLNFNFGSFEVTSSQIILLRENPIKLYSLDTNYTFISMSTDESLFDYWVSDYYYTETGLYTIMENYLSNTVIIGKFNANNIFSIIEIFDGSNSEVADQIMVKDNIVAFLGRSNSDDLPRLINEDDLLYDTRQLFLSVFTLDT